MLYKIKNFLLIWFVMLSNSYASVGAFSYLEEQRMKSGTTFLDSVMQWGILIIIVIVIVFLGVLYTAIKEKFKKR